VTALGELKCQAETVLPLREGALLLWKGLLLTCLAEQHLNFSGIRRVRTAVPEERLSDGLFSWLALPDCHLCTLSWGKQQLFGIE
jgi:hypothetical protein